MKSLMPFTFLVVLLILITLACNLPQQVSALPTPTSTPTMTPTDIPKPTQVPTEIPPTVIQPTATLEVVLSPYQPSGYFVVPPAGGAILVYDLSNQLVSQLAAPGLYGENPANAHLAGHLSNGPVDLSLTYFSRDANALLLTDQNGVTTLRNVPDFYMLAGIPTIPYIAYTQLEYAEAATLHSSLIVGDAALISSAPAVMTVVDTGSYAVRPLVIAHDQDQALGVYYTSVPYGIGGDIVFLPHRALYYLDLATYQSQQLLDISTSPSAFSPDLTWLAYSSQNAGPMMIAPTANLKNALTLPLLPESDRGAGNAVFSPDNQYIAWKEGSGWMMSETPNFHATIRIATTSGAITAQIPDASIAALIGNPASIWVQPVGWLNESTLLLEVRGDDWADATLLHVNADGSGLAYLVSGIFMGFVYP
mgnify:CR=1 FL=1